MKTSILVALVLSSSPLPGDPAAGRKTFTGTCYMCHGMTGRGDGPAAPGYPRPPANFHDQKWSYLSEEKQIHIVTDGGPAEGLNKCMPAFGEVLSPKQVRDVVAYVRSLMKEK